MPVPTYITVFVLTADLTIIVALVGGLALALKRAGWTSDARWRTVAPIAGVLVAWFAVALALANGGFYQAAANRFPTIAFGAIIPLAIGLLLLRQSKTVWHVLDAVPQQWLVSAQFYRVLGVIFILLLSIGLLPPQFAVPAGWGDLAVGILAPVAGFASVRSGDGFAVRVWNIFGLADLVVAVATGFLTSPSPMQMLSLDAPNYVISAFPLVMVPVFAVPLSILLHAASLMKLSRERWVGQPA